MGEKRGKERNRARVFRSSTLLLLVASDHQHPPILEIMSFPRHSPLLPWDVIANIIEANWIHPVDHSEKKTLHLFKDPSESFVVRCAGIRAVRKVATAWMTVSIDPCLFSTLLLSQSTDFSSSCRSKGLEGGQGKRPSSLPSFPFSPPPQSDHSVLYPLRPLLPDITTPVSLSATSTPSSALRTWSKPPSPRIPSAPSFDTSLCNESLARRRRRSNRRTKMQRMRRKSCGGTKCVASFVFFRT